MARDMHRDAELLNSLLDEAESVRDERTAKTVQISVKVLAHWTDRSFRTISDYRNGKSNIPIAFWRLILERHFDNRIVSLIIPDDVEFDSFRLPAEPTTSASFFRDVVESEAEHHKKSVHIAQILQNEGAHDLDADSVLAYDRAYRNHRSRDAALHHAIMQSYRQSVGRAS